MITIYHNPRCSKSRQSLKLLKDNTSQVQVIEYLKQPLTGAELKNILKKLKLRPEQLLRKGEKLYKDDFADTQYSDEEWISIMVKHPVLIERPIVINGEKAVIGRPPEQVLDIL
jgi:arsenate reductase (glutaredoxin)